MDAVERIPVLPHGRVSVRDGPLGRGLRLRRRGLDLALDLLAQPRRLAQAVGDAVVAQEPALKKPSIVR